MKHFLPMLALCCSTFAVSAQNTPELFSRVEISLAGKNITALAALGIETDHGQYVPGRSLTTEISESELKTIQNAGFQATILIPDLQAWLRTQPKTPAATSRSNGCGETIPEYPTPANYTYGTMAGYLTYQQMLDVLDDMAAKYPDLISPRAIVSDTNLSWEGRPLWYVKISDNPGAAETERQVLYTSLHHAREPNSLSQMIFYMWYLLENYAADPEVKRLVDNLELYFIPCVNPDGYVYNETTNPDGYGFWRKNRRDNGDGTYGVDLNRNYGYFWGNDDNGSSPITNSQTYRGPGPFSEPETRAVRDFCMAHDFLFTLNYHTSGNLLIYPWAYSDAPADSAFVKYGQLFTRYNKYTYGTSSETVGYAVNGSSDDWMLSDGGTFSFTPEVGTTGFWPSFDEIDGLNRDNVWPNLSVARCALQYGELSDKSEPFIYQNTTELSFSLSRYGLLDGPFDVTLTPLSPEITTSVASQSFTLQPFQTSNFSFPIAVSAGVATGTELLWAVEVESGGFARTDTLRKTWMGSATLSLLYEDDCADYTGWVGTFENTTETYVSAPACFTDSPNSFYFPNSNVAMYFEDALAIPADASFARLRFFARWDIEEDRDFAQVFVLDNSFTLHPLCGLYTESGAGGFQPETEPVYDGLQLEWVEESVDLSDFAGQSVLVGFLFQADDFLERDGIFIDDIRIEYADEASSSPDVFASGTLRLLQNQPNPARTSTLLRWEKGAGVTGEATLEVFNMLGEKMYERPVDLGAESQARIDVRSWAPGIYTGLLRAASGQTQALKMSVAR